jgi:hypothetical protein
MVVLFLSHVQLAYILHSTDEVVCYLLPDILFMLIWDGRNFHLTGAVGSRSDQSLTELAVVMRMMEP